jgi:hypothetical protein
MKTIYKYPVQITDRQQVSMPSGALIVHFANDPGGQPSIWAEVETTNPVVSHDLWIVGTGHPIPDAALIHVASMVCQCFVWHLYIG